VHARPVLDDHDVLAFGTAEAKLGDGGSALGEQALLVLGVRPGTGDHARAVPRPDVILVGAHDRIEKLCPLSASSASSVATRCSIADGGAS
jgi:hypothetical protein